MAEQKSINALGREAAYQLANVTKTAPQFAAITPRWSVVFSIIKGWSRAFIASTRSWRGRRRWTYYAARTLHA